MTLTDIQPTMPDAPKEGAGVKNRPILFSGAMVRALLAGTKTQTRRVCKLDVRAGMPEPELASLLRCCPYGQPGDRLWVRETWATHPDYGGRHAIYRTDRGCEHDAERWTPSIHMPRWASRITLEVTGVRVERLQNIGEGDAKAEGVQMPDGTPTPPEWWSYRREFAHLWEQINGPGSWDANPWAWVVEFKRIEP